MLCLTYNEGIENESIIYRKDRFDYENTSEADRDIAYFMLIFRLYEK